MKYDMTWTSLDSRLESSLGTTHEISKSLTLWLCWFPHLHSNVVHEWTTYDPPCVINRAIIFAPWQLEFTAKFHFSEIIFG